VSHCSCEQVGQRDHLLFDSQSHEQSFLTMESKQVSSKGDEDLPKAEGDIFDPNLIHRSQSSLEPLVQPFHLRNIYDNPGTIFFETAYYENCSPQASKFLNTECFIHEPCLWCSRVIPLNTRNERKRSNKIWNPSFQNILISKQALTTPTFCLLAFRI
jgi:hypothetical protein